MSDEIMGTDDLQKAAVTTDIAEFKQLLQDFGASAPDETAANSQQAVTGLEYIKSAIRLGGVTLISKDEVGTKTEKLTQKMTVIYRDQKKAAIEEFIADGGVVTDEAKASVEVVKLRAEVADLKRALEDLTAKFNEQAGPDGKLLKAIVSVDGHVGAVDTQVQKINEYVGAQQRKVATPDMPNA
jgi:hypothetical protein